MTAPRRRWFRFAFSLRTLFVVVTVFGCWLGYQLNWIRQRREFLGGPVPGSGVAHFGHFSAWQDRPVDAPWQLRLLGESGCCIILSDYPRSSDENRRLKALFPEAAIAANENGAGEMGR